MKKPIKLFYYKGETNFGDLMGPLMIERLYDHKVEYADSRHADMISIGSILDEYAIIDRASIKRFLKGFMFATRKTHVWGSGFIHPSHKLLWRNLNFHAVRGELTMGRLNLERRIALGDPGLLADRLIDKTPIKKFEYGIVPHYADHGNQYIKYLEQILPSDKTTVINVLDPVCDVITAIGQCENIISTSLHGLIVSDSLGVPNLWARTDKVLVGGKYKFYDYYSVFGIDEPNCIELTSEPSLDDIKKLLQPYERKGLEKIKQRIFKSFPFA